MTNNVDNYFSQAGTGSDNALVIGGTQTVTGTLALNGTTTSTNNVGTAATGSTVVHTGDGINMRATITVNTTLPAIAGGAALAVGKLLYTLPAGAVLVKDAYMSLAITQTEGNINADTPDVGIGTVIASGVVSVLSGTATFENIVTGQTAANCTGTATVKTTAPTAGTALAIETGDAHTIYANVADTWAASGDAGALLTGTVIVDYTFAA